MISSTATVKNNGKTVPFLKVITRMEGRQGKENFILKMEVGKFSLISFYLLLL